MGRMQPGDYYIIYYAPRERMRAGDFVQAFVAFGRILPASHLSRCIKQISPFSAVCRVQRRRGCPIRPLLQKLSFTRDRVSWGQALRLGTFKIEPDDLKIIAGAMRIALA